MAWKWSSGIVNTIAPGLASFSRADVPDLTGEFLQAPHWVANYFLNSVLRSSYEAPIRQAALGFLRRTDRAFQSYHEARRRTLEYVAGFDPGQPKVRLYYDAVADWEQFALQFQMAVDLFLLLAETPAFVEGDGSPEQRLYDLANAVKHFRGHLKSRKFSHDDVLPLWIDSDGLKSFGLSVSYQEAAGLLRDLSVIADRLQDPKTAAGENEKSGDAG
jgi:hypothetical protein